MASRGVPSPASTSGQTGTHSTYRPNTSVRNRSFLCPPSKRTSSPNRQRLTPTRMGSEPGISLSTISPARPLGLIVHDSEEHLCRSGFRELLYLPDSSQNFSPTDLPTLVL